MPFLRVLAGPSLDALEPISDLVNSNQSYKVSSPFFEGELVANIRGFTNEQGETVPDGPYFAKEGKGLVTWSIMARGRFLVPISADDILFGNTFDRPLNLPWGTGAALKFASYIDPTLEYDLQSQTKPWALSPLISTMPKFSHKQVPEGHVDESPFPPDGLVTDSTSQLYLASSSCPSSRSPSPSPSIDLGSQQSRKELKKSPSSLALGTLAVAVRSVSSLKSRGNQLQKVFPKRYQFSSSSERRRYFSTPDARKDIIFGPDDVIDTDFCYGFFSFSPSITLRIPGGLEFDLMKYWDNQPVRFVCCARKEWIPPSCPDVNLDEQQDDDSTPWGQVFWCMALELVED